MSGSTDFSNSGLPDPSQDIWSDSFLEDEPAWILDAIEEMTRAWETGARPELGSILEKFPEIDHESAVRLLYEDVCIRRENGTPVATDEIVSRFPQYQAEIRLLLSCDRLLEPPRPVSFPEVGEMLGDFNLRLILGRGTSGRTYLAYQPNLADRPVALKVLPQHHEEHLSLARLQHTYIVPLYSEHVFEDRGLRGLCMPYLGGTDLSQVLQGLASTPLEHRKWSDFIAILDRCRRPIDPPITSLEPFRKNLDRISYIQGICRLVSFLAEALHYAHERGMIHMDVKPSNILISSDGQPMLLDFHLSRPPIAVGEPLPNRLGGTPSYMSPEQREAIDALRYGRPFLSGIDRRSDIYSLGLLLAEALTVRPVEGELYSPDRTRQACPQISTGLADIIAKCLKPRVSDRYPNAEILAEDLERHFKNEPLTGVENRDLGERYRKWRKRRPNALLRLAAPLSVVFAVTVLAILGARAVLSRSQEIIQGSAVLADTLREASEHRIAGRATEALREIERAAGLLKKLPESQAIEFQLRLNTERTLAERSQRMARLHALAESSRGGQGLTPEPSQDSGRLLKGLEDALEDYRHVSQNPGGTVEEKDSRFGVRDDLIELATAWANLRIRPAPNDPDAKAQVVDVFQKVNAVVGASPALALEQARLVPSRLQTTGSDSTSATSSIPLPESLGPGESFAVGRSLFRSGRWSEASSAFRQTLRSHPEHIWANFYEGVFAYRMRRFDEAFAAFSVSVALAPETAECYFNRALTLEALKLDERALEDYSKVIKLDDRRAAARLNRGILYYRLKRYDAAIADFKAGQLLDQRDLNGAIPYNLALAFHASGHKIAAIQSARDALKAGHRDAPALLERLQSSR